MNVVYHCYGSAHSSVTAAAIHLGLLPRDRRPTEAELLAVPRFDRTLTRELGTPFFVGRDRAGRGVYALGRGRAARLVLNCLESLVELEGASPVAVVMINALPRLSLVTTVGGTLSRGLGLIWPGRPLTLWGVRRCYFRFVRLVEETERLLSLVEEKEERPEPNPK
ncbi:MAG: DUF3189 family protein [Bacillota bacterium]|nr:DUF3189 family protein [Bacillota bacterium]